MTCFTQIAKIDAKAGQLYRITIRATDESVPPVLAKFMEETFSMGVDKD